MSKLYLNIIRTIIIASVLTASCQKVNQGVFFHKKEAIPNELSEWGLFQVQSRQLSLSSGMIAYDLREPLFSDYAHKLRTIWLPSGSIVEFQPEKEFDFPVGTIISKTFYYPLNDQNHLLKTHHSNNYFVNGSLDLKQVQLIETRLLIHYEDGWEAVPYVWNEAQTLAKLEIAGDIKELVLYDKESENVAFTYQIPDVNQCSGCHAPNLTTAEIKPIGLKTRHLNKTNVYMGSTKNQLIYWQEKGYLSNVPESLLLNQSDIELEDLNTKARAYLDINCGHCHNSLGAADTSGLLLDISVTKPRQYGVCKPPIAAGKGSGNRRFSIVPRHPEESIISFRMRSTKPAEMMPELGRSLVHTEGVALIDAWISGMSGSCGSFKK